MPARQLQAEGRQERAVGADPVDDRFGFDGRDDLRLGEDDPQRLAATELDEDRLTRDQVGEPIRDGVRVRP